MGLLMALWFTFSRRLFEVRPKLFEIGAQGNPLPARLRLKC
jgi:hypothetical protein